MKKTTLRFGVAAAAVAAVGIPVGAVGLQLFLPFSAACKVTLMMAALLYVTALASVSGRRRGRVLAILAFAVGVTVPVVLPLTMSGTVLWLAGLVCAARVLLLAETVLGAALEACLAALALLAAAGTLVLTRSVGLTAWSFFLVLAAGPVVTAFLRGAASGGGEERNLPRFERAFRAAEGSLEALGRR